MAPENDSDRPRKKKKKKAKSSRGMLWIAGGAVVLIGVGVLIVVLINLPGDISNVPGKGKTPGRPTTPANVSQETFAKLKEGMTHDQVEQVLGGGSAATVGDIDRIQPGLSPMSIQRNEQLKLVAGNGRCFVWNNEPHHIIVVYNRSPAEKGTLNYAVLIHHLAGPGGARDVKNLEVLGFL